MIEAMKQALEALEWEIALTPYPGYWLKKAITSLRQAIEQAEKQDHAERLAEKNWQYFECPVCGSEGARAFPKPVQEPVAFKIYKPTPPRGAIPNVRDAELPWVYDQDPSSGNVASMWVTPVKATLQAQQTESITQITQDHYSNQNEPVAWVNWCAATGKRSVSFECESELASQPLYTTPQPQREWVGLTDEEMRDLEKQFEAERVRTSDEEYLVIYPAAYWQWQRAIEAKLKQKNGYAEEKNT